MEAGKRTICVTVDNGTHVFFEVIDGMLTEVTAQPLRSSMERITAKDLSSAVRSAYAVAKANGWV